MMAGKHELAEQTLAAALASLAELEAAQSSANKSDRPVDPWPAALPVGSFRSGGIDPKNRPLMYSG